MMGEKNHIQLRSLVARVLRFLTQGYFGELLFVLFQEDLLKNRLNIFGLSFSIQAQGVEGESLFL